MGVAVEIDAVVGGGAGAVVVGAGADVVVGVGVGVDVVCAGAEVVDDPLLFLVVVVGVLVGVSVVCCCTFAPDWVVVVGSC